MLKKTSLILAATMGIIAGAVSVQAQETSPAPRDHMMMQGMGHMHAQMSKMAENCNKMMEGKPSSASPRQQKK
jgi:hypothetical protein